MKLMDIQCPHCLRCREMLVANEVQIGEEVDHPVGEECDCGVVDYGIALPCFGPVRTPNNSASYLDGHREGADGLKHQMNYRKAKYAMQRAKAGVISPSEGGAAAEALVSMGRHST